MATAKGLTSCYIPMGATIVTDKIADHSSKPMRQVATLLREQGISTFVKWDWIFYAPPLIINEEQIREGLLVLDQGLSLADTHCAE